MPKGVYINTVESIQAKLVVEDWGFSTCCLVWHGCCTKDGYGVVGYHGKIQTVHTVLFKELVSEIPDGYEIDHKCRVRPCGNVDHLEVVTHLENMRRAWKPFCSAGHPMVSGSFRVRERNGKVERKCLTCHPRARWGTIYYGN